MTRARIIGTGSYLPEKILTNDDLSRMVDTSDEWIYTRTGMRARHIAAEDETTSDMALAAARPAMEAAGITAEALDLIILATTTPDLHFPATACKVQAELGAKCPAFDIQAVCSGFVYALEIADKMIKSGEYKRVLAIGAEKMSRLIDWTDRSTCVLFGDGAGAAVLEATEARGGILATEIRADGDLYDVLKTNDAGKIHMDGQDVFKTAVQKVPEVSLAVLEKAEIPVEKLDWFIPHQANIRIIDAAVKRLGVAEAKVIKTIESQANTSAASVGISLDMAAREGKLKRGDKVLLTAMGAGFTWGAIALEY